jgi:hypothetical protein
MTAWQQSRTGCKQAGVTRQATEPLCCAGDQATITSSHPEVVSSEVHIIQSLQAPPSPPAVVFEAPGSLLETLTPSDPHAGQPAVYKTEAQLSQFI